MRCLPVSAVALVIGGASFARADVDFRKEVLPILQKSCFKCHRATHKEAGKEVKPKGGLALDGVASILKGGSDEGAAVTAEDPDKSSIYRRIILPQSHEDVMPPKDEGKPLGFKETEVIKNWIMEGASFGDFKGIGDTGGPNPTPGAPAVVKKTDPNAVGVGKPSDDAIKALTSTGAQVTAIATDSPLLRVEWISGLSGISDKDIPKVLAVGEAVTELNLAGTKVTDEGVKLLAKLPRLTWLSLANTGVTNAGIAELKPLINLTYLNLYGTSVGDEALPAIAAMRKLKALHAYKTRITPAGADKLKKALLDVRVQIE